MKTTNLLLSFILVVLGICVLILADANLLSIELSDLIVRTIGLVDLIELLIFEYIMVKKLKNKQ